MNRRSNAKIETLCEDEHYILGQVFAVVPSVYLFCKECMYLTDTVPVHPRDCKNQKRKVSDVLMKTYLLVRGE